MERCRLGSPMGGVEWTWSKVQAGKACPEVPNQRSLFCRLPKRLYWPVSCSNPHLSCCPILPVQALFKKERGGTFSLY